MFRGTAEKVGSYDSGKENSSRGKKTCNDYLLGFKTLVYVIVKKKTAQTVGLVSWKPDQNLLPWNHGQKTKKVFNAGLKIVLFPTTSDPKLGTNLVAIELGSKRS